MKKRTWSETKKKITRMTKKTRVYWRMTRFPSSSMAGVSERDANKTGKVLNIISNERGLVSNRDKYRYI